MFKYDHEDGTTDYAVVLRYTIYFSDGSTKTIENYLLCSEKHYVLFKNEAVFPVETSPNAKGYNFLKCKTDLWAFGFWFDDKINEYQIAHCQQLQEWFKLHEQQFQLWNPIASRIKT